MYPVCFVNYVTSLYAPSRLPLRGGGIIAGRACPVLDTGSGMTEKGIIKRSRILVTSVKCVISTKTPHDQQDLEKESSHIPSDMVLLPTFFKKDIALGPFRNC